MDDELIPSEDQLKAALGDPELLARSGYKLTPAGSMVLVLMEEGYTIEQAALLSRRISDSIFLSGFVYFHESQVRLEPRQ